MVDPRVIRGAAAAVGAAGGLVAADPAGTAIGGAAAERGAKHLIDRREEASEAETTDPESDPS
jgi:hypothetical protein